MAKRRNTRKVETEDLQGEGSYVILKNIPYKTVREARQKMNSGKSKDLTDEEQAKIEDEFVQEIFSLVVTEWDWVDDDDEPMKLPSNGLDIGELTIDEISFIMEQATGQGSVSKNSD